MGAAATTGPTSPPTPQRRWAGCPKACCHWTWVDQLERYQFRCRCGATFAKSIGALASTPPQSPKKPPSKVPPAQAAGDGGRQPQSPSPKVPPPPPQEQPITAGPQQVRKELQALAARAGATLLPDIRRIIDTLPPPPKASPEVPPARGLQQALAAHETAETAFKRAIDHQWRLE